MKPFNPAFTAAMVAVAALILANPTTSYADTYQVFDLGVQSGHSIYGIDDSGAVVIYINSYPEQTYVTVRNGVVVNTSNTPPSLNYDNGTACVPTASAGIAIYYANARCNNGHEVYFASYPYPTSTPPDERNGIFTGPNLSDLLVMFPGGTFDGARLNSSGDFVWVDGRSDKFYQAIDLTPQFVPEPGCIALLGTGLLASIGAIRRRLLQN